MWTDSDFSVPTENRFLSLCNEEMARGGFQMASKRKRTNTGQGESDNRAIFMLSSSDDKLNIIFDELQCVRKAQEKMNNGMLSFQNSFRTMGEGLTQVIHATNKHTDMLKTLAYKSIDLEARSRRNNLIFWGLCENYQENCFALIREFIKNQFDLDSDKMYLARAHRLGARKNNNRNQRRPIVVNFRDYCDTEAIMSRAYMLKDTPFSVDYDLPKEISVARKALWSELKTIKTNNPRVKCQIIYPAKLVVDGKVVRDEFPDWYTVMKGSRLSDFSYIDQTLSFDRTPLHTTYEQSRDYEMEDQSSSVLCESEGGTQEQAIQPESVQSSIHRVQETSSSNDSQSTPNIATPTDTHLSKSNSTDSLLRQNTDINLPPLNDTVPIVSQVNDSVPQTPLFRPFSTTCTTENVNSDIDNTVNTSQCSSASEIPERGNHVSRSMQRGVRRSQSVSVNRGATNLASGTSTGAKKPVDKNRHDRAKNSSQSGTITDDVSHGENRAPEGPDNKQLKDQTGVQQKS